MGDKKPKKSDVPAGLGAGGSKLWNAVLSRYALRPDELRTLEDACREADLIDALREALDDSTLMVTGSQGQKVINPLVSELRQHRSVLKSLMQSLKLPEDGDSEREAGERSSQAREAANARWSRRGA